MNVRLCSGVRPLNILKKMAVKVKWKQSSLRNDSILLLNGVDLCLPFREEDIASVIVKWGVCVVAEQRCQILLTTTCEAIILSSLRALYLIAQQEGWLVAVF